MSLLSTELEALALTRKHELEVFLIHCVIVAGKSAPFGNAKTKELLKDVGDLTPFEYLRKKIKRSELIDLLKETKTGNYQKMITCFCRLVLSDIDLETCTLEQLENIPYIGLKTSRYFFLYTRPENETNDIAVLDTHSLKWLAKDRWAVKRLLELGVKKVPSSTPSRTAKKLYLKLQQIVCEDAKRKGISSRQWDSQNWDSESNFVDLSRARVLGTRKTT